MAALDKQTSLFFGTKVDGRLREAMFVAKPGDKKYFDGTSEEFLKIVEVGEEKWIGKVIPPGPGVTEVEDIGRNILSILRKVAPNVRISASTVKIFVMSGAVVAAKGTESGDADAPLESDDGAFIAY